MTIKNDDQNLPAHIVSGEDEMPSYRPTMSDDLGTKTEIRPMQIKIMQPSTPEVAANEISGGVFASGLIGELGASIIHVPLKHGEFRIMNNPSKAFGENEIVCMSADALKGYTNPESDYEHKDMAGRSCLGCPFAQFTTDPKTKRRKAPLCTFNRTFSGYLPEHELIGQITYRRTSQPAGEDIMTIIQQSKMFGKDAFQLTLRLTRRGAYTYYVPILKRVPVADEWHEGLLNALELLSTVGAQMAEDAVAEAVADSGAGFNPETGFATSQKDTEEAKPRRSRERQTITKDEVGDIADII